MSQTAAFVATILSFVISPLTFAQSTYTITDLGVLPGGTGSGGQGINTSGYVTGVVPISGGYHAFLYNPASGMIDLGVFPGDYGSSGQGINDSGQVTGFSSHNTGIPGCCLAATPHAFVYDPSSPASLPGKDLGTLYPGDQTAVSIGYAINKSGKVAGSSGTYSIPPHAFVYDLSTNIMTDIGTLPFGRVSYGYGINDAGQVTGQSDVQTLSGYQSHAFLYTPGVGMADLGTLGGNLSVGTAINASGQVAGYSNTVLNGQPHAFLYDPSKGAMADLGTLGGDYSYAYGINASGDVVGYSNRTVGMGDAHAFLYRPGKGMIDINTLLPSGAGWTLLTAYAINDSGQITGQGANPNGQGNAFLLSPQVGGITVSTNVALATFTVTGPATYAGVGQLFVTEAPAGSYTITYGPVSGYGTPPAETKTLPAAGSISFTGSYALKVPIMSQVSPSSGDVGAVVTITGDNFGTTKASSVVRFNSIIAAVQFWSNTTITAVVPAVPSLNLSYDITVISAQGASNPIGFLVTGPVSGVMPPGQSDSKPCPPPPPHQGINLTVESSTGYTVLIPSKQVAVCSTADNLTVDIILENNWKAWYFVTIFHTGTVGQGLPQHFLLPPGDTSVVQARRIFRLTFARGDMLSFFADASFSSTLPPHSIQDTQLLSAFAAEFLWRLFSGSPLPQNVIDLAIFYADSDFLNLGVAIGQKDIVGIIQAVNKIAANPLITTQLTLYGFPIVKRIDLIKNAARVEQVLEFLIDELIAANSFPNDTLTIRAR